MLLTIREDDMIPEKVIVLSIGGPIPRDLWEGIITLLVDEAALYGPEDQTSLSDVADSFITQSILPRSLTVHWYREKGPWIHNIETVLRDAGVSYDLWFYPGTCTIPHVVYTRYGKSAEISLTYDMKPYILARDITSVANLLQSLSDGEHIRPSNLQVIIDILNSMAEFVPVLPVLEVI